MPRGRATGTLARLERQLHDLNATRQRLIVAIRAAVNHLTAGSPNGAAPARRPVARTAKPARPKRRFSAAARKRLSQLARERWAKARKAGKTRLD